METKDVFTVMFIIFAISIFGFSLGNCIGRGSPSQESQARLHRCEIEGTKRGCFQYSSRLESDGCHCIVRNNGVLYYSSEE